MLTALYITAGLVIVCCLVVFAISAMTPRPDSVGLKDGQLAPLPDSPNCVSTVATDSVHAIKPFTFIASPNQAMQSLRAVVESMPGAAVVEHRDGYLYAEFRSRIFRYVDDVEFLIDGDALVIHFRSASRVGYSDMGVNRARLEQIRQLFNK